MSSSNRSASTFSSSCSNFTRCEILSTSPANKQKRVVVPEIMNQEDSMLSSIARIESLLNYKFKNPKLCEEALTHSSDTNHISYQTLEFVGDSALGLAITNYLFLNYRDVGPGALSALRAANISTEKLARIAVKHKLYDLVRKNSPKLDEMVEEFTLAVDKENEMGLYWLPYGGSVIKAPKVLADIVEAIIAAVYIDCDFHLERCWAIIRGLLEPITTAENLDEQPVTTLHEYCQKKGKDLYFSSLEKRKYGCDKCFCRWRK